MEEGKKNTVLPQPRLQNVANIVWSAVVCCVLIFSTRGKRLCTSRHCRGQFHPPNSNASKNGCFFQRERSAMISPREQCKCSPFGSFDTRVRNLLQLRQANHKESINITFLNKGKLILSYRRPHHNTPPQDAWEWLEFNLGV